MNSWEEVRINEFGSETVHWSGWNTFLVSLDFYTWGLQQLHWGRSDTSPVHAVSAPEILENEGWLEYLNYLLPGNWLSMNMNSFPMSIPFLKPLSSGLAWVGCFQLLPVLWLALWDTWFPLERAWQLLSCPPQLSEGAADRSLWEQKLLSAALTEQFMLVETLIAMWICAPVPQELYLPCFWSRTPPLLPRRLL